MLICRCVGRSQDQRGDPLSSEVSLLLDAFRPGKELDDPTLFAGRPVQVVQLAHALHVDGSCPVIYGDRGLGKSSLALQLERIARGDTVLLDAQAETNTDRLPPDADLIDVELLRHAADWVLNEEDTYLTFYVACTNATPDTETLLRRVANALMNPDIERFSQPSEGLIERKTSMRLSFKMFSTETSRTYRPTLEQSDENSTIEDMVLRLARELTNKYQRRVLVIIDEFDIVEDSSGLAAFLKVASSSDLKFVLVGIADSVSGLLTDHRSLERTIVPVEVPKMSIDELQQIIYRAGTRLRLNGIQIDFEPRARRSVAELADGSPWYAHLLGQSALMIAHQQDLTSVNVIHVASASRSLNRNRFAQQFSDLYCRAVRDSRSREQVLRTLALFPERNIPTALAYRAARRLGVSNPSSYVRNLCDPNYGAVVSRPLSTNRGFLRFNDGLFKIYARIAEPVYAGANEEVRAAFRAEVLGPPRRPSLPDDY
jgi:Cdc6-like AAA superfamily ATPase